jgi:hypothetical protein
LDVKKVKGRALLGHEYKEAMDVWVFIYLKFICMNNLWPKVRCLIPKPKKWPKVI